MRVLKPLVYAAGTVLFAASILFILLFAVRHWSEVSAAQIIHPELLAASTALYAISHLSTGLAWPFALRRLGEPIGFASGLRIGLISQAGKYLPGNIAHYLGRGGLAATAGIPLRTSGLSIAVELASALGAGLIICALMLVIDPRPLAFLPRLEAQATALGGLVALAALVLVVWSTRRGFGLSLFVGPALLLAVSFALSGLSFHALLVALGYSSASAAAAIAAFAIAWTLGFLVPGAPAGIGVREATLVALIGPAVGPGPALAAVLLHRLLTACVDGVAALVGYAWFASARLSKK